MAKRLAALPTNSCLFGECLAVLRTLPSNSVHCVVTSPPYWGLRDYHGHPDQLGQEPTPEAFGRRLVRILREARRVLRPDGTLWLNLGDSYAGRGNGGGGRFMDERGEGAWSAQASLKGFRKAPTGMKDKDLVGIPWMVAFALRRDGWWLRSEVIWSKPNPQPESVKDRPTKAHEQIFLLTKSESYFYDHEGTKEPVSGTARPRGNGVNPSFSAATSGALVEKRAMRDVWTIPSEPYHGSHFATFPTELARRCVHAGCPEGGVVLDPFFGSGTVGQVAEGMGRKWVGIELCEENAPLIAKRTAQVGMVFGEASNA